MLSPTLITLIVGTPAVAVAPVQSAVYTWPQIERQIARHREHVRSCGPLSAVRSLRLLGQPVDIQSAMQQFRDPDPRGVPVEQVLRLCQDYRPGARLVRLPGKQFHRLTTPCILLVNQGKHALVLQSPVGATRVAEIWDPSDMRVKTVPLEQLSQQWTGDAILLRPRPWMSSVLGLANGLIVVSFLARRALSFQWRNVARDVD
jgi:hypothetical protein